MCPSCRYHYSISARRKIAILAEKGTFKEINKWVESNDPLKFSPKLSYKKRIAQDQTRHRYEAAGILLRRHTRSLPHGAVQPIGSGSGRSERHEPPGKPVGPTVYELGGVHGGARTDQH